MSQNTYQKYCIYFKSVTFIIKKKRQHVVALCLIYVYVYIFYSK